MDRLQRRGWTLVNRYALCKVKLEIIDHFLLHCVKARLLWQLVFSIFGIRWVICKTDKETLLGWNVTFIEKRRIKAWRAASTCIFWTLLNERNRRFFYSEELLDQRLKSLFLNNFSMWVRVYIGGGYTHLIDFIEWLGIGIGSGYFFVPSFLLFACFTCILLVYSCAFFNTISYLSKKSVLSKMIF